MFFAGRNIRILKGVSTLAVSRAMDGVIAACGPEKIRVQIVIRLWWRKYMVIYYSIEHSDSICLWWEPVQAVHASGALASTCWVEPMATDGFTRRSASGTVLADAAPLG